MMGDSEAPISKTTALPALSLGLTVAVLAVAFFGGRDLGKWKTEQEAEHNLVVIRLDRLESRFDSYTGKKGSNTADIAELNRVMLDLEKELSVILEAEVGR